MDTSPDEQALVDVLPSDGRTLSNRVARERLGWTDERYWSVRDSLVDRNLVVRGPGRGGTVRLVLPEPGSAAVTVPVAVEIGGATPKVEDITETVRRETELYEPMRDVLQSDWARDRRATPLAVEVTAMQGRRSTGGVWSRPDIVSVEIKTYQYVPGKFLEVITFEVKPSDAIDVQAVYESLAHRRSATHSYVLLHVPQHSSGAVAEQVNDLRGVARSHGIGLIVASDPANYDTWDELEEAQRVEPDPGRLDQFIGTQLSETVRSRIARGLR